MATYCTQSIKKKAKKSIQPISSLGFVMPFQPTMCNEESIQSSLDYTFNIIERKLINTYSIDYTKTMLVRIKRLFHRLNFNTHRKSLAVLLSANSEKVIYLNFPVTLFVSTGNFISILGLVTGINQEIGFYLLFIFKRNITLYEYTDKHLHKVYEQMPDTISGYLVEEVMRASSVITIMNKNSRKPVFIAGSREQVDSFQRAIPYPEIVFKLIRHPVQNNAETAQNMVTEIVNQWSYWLAEFDAGRLAMAKKCNTLIFQYEGVLKALCKSANGLMLMDNQLIKKLHKPEMDNNYSEDTNMFSNQLERFVDRGNCIGIKEDGLLKDCGGIALLPDMIDGHLNELTFRKHRISGQTGNLF